jgi:hypothetical protein
MLRANPDRLHDFNRPNISGRESRRLKELRGLVPRVGYDSCASESPSGKPLWVQRLKVWSCCASLSVGIFPRTPSESLDGRGIDTSICGKLPLDRPFRQPSSAPKRKTVTSRISKVFTGVCRVVISCAICYYHKRCLDF